jgi:hypothetical protein
MPSSDQSCTICTYEHTLLGEYKYNTAVFIPVICWYLIYREIENLKRLRHEMNIFLKAYYNKHVLCVHALIVFTIFGFFS